MSCAGRFKEETSEWLPPSRSSTPTPELAPGEELRSLVESAQAGHGSRRLKAKRWRAAFDSSGRLTALPKLLARVLEGGVDDSIRAEVWEYLLGCFSPNSTHEERSTIRKARRARYSELVEQCREMHSSLGTGQLAHAAGEKMLDMRGGEGERAAASERAREGRERVTALARLRLEALSEEAPKKGQLMRLKSTNGSSLLGQEKEREEGESEELEEYSSLSSSEGERERLGGEREENDMNGSGKTLRRERARKQRGVEESKGGGRNGESVREGERVPTAERRARAHSDEGRIEEGVESRYRCSVGESDGEKKRGDCRERAREERLAQTLEEDYFGDMRISSPRCVIDERGGDGEGKGATLSRTLTLSEIWLEITSRSGELGLTPGESLREEGNAWKEGDEGGGKRGREGERVAKTKSEGSWKGLYSGKWERAGKSLSRLASTGGLSLGREGERGGGGGGRGEEEGGKRKGPRRKAWSEAGTSSSRVREGQVAGEGEGEGEGGSREGQRGGESVLNPVVALGLEATEERVADWLWTLHKIAVDVVRTDQHLEFFKEPSNMARVSDILAVHAWVDPETGYCQGMCDIVAPFVVLFEDNADAFWCFEYLISRERQKFLVEGPVGVLRQLEALRAVVALTDGALLDRLRDLEADTFMFAFRMLLVMFRRELPFPDAILLWEMMWAADFEPLCLQGLLQHPPGALLLDLPEEPLAEIHTPHLKGIWRLGANTAAAAAAAAPRPASTAPWRPVRHADEDMAVFCVAAILRQNRRKLMKELDAAEDAIKMFNDVEFNIDVPSCVVTAIKLRKEYFRKLIKVPRILPYTGTT